MQFDMCLAGLHLHTIYASKKRRSITDKSKWSVYLQGLLFVTSERKKDIFPKRHKLYSSSGVGFIGINYYATEIIRH